MSELTKAALEQMLKILSPVRPKQVRTASGLGSLAEQLRGGPQAAGQLLNQLRGKPGVKPGALSEYLGHVDPEQRMTPKELGAEVRSPKLFAQRGMTNAMDDEQVHELADDLLYGPHFREQRESIVRGIIADSNPKDLGIRNLLRNRHWTPEQFKTAENLADDVLNGHGSNSGDVNIHDIYTEELSLDALDMARNQSLGTKSMNPAYDQYQRQLGLTRGLSEERARIHDANTGYFETVLRGTPSRGQHTGLPYKDAAEYGEYHFANPSQLGHVRGSVTPGGNVYAEELQSDPLEWIGKYGEQEAVSQPSELDGIYGKLGRMLIDRSAEARALSVSFPDANRIGSVRNSGQMPFFRDVYDKRLVKELYAPLAKRGVPFRTENGWTTMELPEGVLEAIRKDRLLDYKRGGLVRA